MTGVIAVLGAPLAELPVQDWLAGCDLRLVLEAGDPDAERVPGEHVVLPAEQRPARLSAELARMCAASLPDRIVHFAAADASRVAAARTAHAIAGSPMFGASIATDRVELRERLRAGGVALLAYAPVDHPYDVSRFGEQHGYPLLVRPRLLNSPWPRAIVDGPEEARLWSHGPYHAAPGGWIVEPHEEHAPAVHAAGLYRGVPLDLCWAYETSAVAGATLTLGLPHEDPRAIEARGLLAGALSTLPDPDVALARADLRQVAGRLVLADLVLGLDDRYPRSLIARAYGCDPAQRYAQAAVGAALPAPPPQPSAIAGRIAVPARRGSPDEVEAVPERFAAPADHVVLPRPGGRYRGGEPDAAVYETGGVDREAVRERLEAFRLWARCLRYRPPARAAA